MSIIFYTTRGASPPGRAVETVIRILKLDVQRRDINLIKKENFEPWFLELNPSHQVPVINDNGYVLVDSHAIIAYLLTVYAPKDILEQYYPTDPKQRGIIDSRWHFENGTLFARVKLILVFCFYGVGEEYTLLEKAQFLAEGVAFLEQILEGKEWLAGDRLTVADISSIMTIDLIEFLLPLKNYKNVSAWAERVRKACPFYEEIGREALNNFAIFFKQNSYDADTIWNQIQNSVKN